MPRGFANGFPRRAVAIFSHWTKRYVHITRIFQRHIIAAKTTGHVAARHQFFKQFRRSRHQLGIGFLFFRQIPIASRFTFFASARLKGNSCFRCTGKTVFFLFFWHNRKAPSPNVSHPLTFGMFHFHHFAFISLSFQFPPTNYSFSNSLFVSPQQYYSAGWWKVKSFLAIF